MSSESLMAVTAVVLIVLLAMLISLFALLYRSLVAVAAQLTELRRDLMPLLSDVRYISENLTEASVSLRQGMQRTAQMTEALGNIGHDLEFGRRTVMGGVGLFGDLLKPWLEKWTAPKPAAVKTP